MRVLLLMAFLVIASCTTGKPELVSYHCPTITLPDDPPSYTGKLNYESEPNEVMQAWVATALAYRNWDRAVREQVALSK